MQNLNDLYELFALVDMRDREDPAPAVDTPPSETPQLPSTPVSLMITNRQRAELKALGFSDEAVAAMRPADAHKHLGI
jgi:hypothetical protein